MISMQSFLVSPCIVIVAMSVTHKSESKDVTSVVTTAVLGMFGDSRGARL